MSLRTHGDRSEVHHSKIGLYSLQTILVAKVKGIGSGDRKNYRGHVVSGRYCQDDGMRFTSRPFVVELPNLFKDVGRYQESFLDL